MKTLKKSLKIIILFLILLIAAVLGVNFYVIKTASPSLQYSIDTQESSISDSDSQKLAEEKADCIMILGAGIIDRETPSEILKDRLDAGIALYKKGVAPKILLTGDNGQKEHNELHAMLSYCIKQGVPKSDIFCDHAGFSTSESMVRAKNIFDVNKLIIVTQKYHEYRAIYLAEAEGMDAIGVSADQHDFEGASYREAREILARNKDFIINHLGNRNAVGGEKISLQGDGSISHGE